MKRVDKYEDIINLPHYQSTTRPRMSNYERAAQFSPFAALKGHDEQINEAIRTTEKKIELGEEQQGELNCTLYKLKEIIKEQPMIKITYFVPDSSKTGGEYRTIEQRVRKIDEYQRKLIFSDREISFDDIYELEILK